MTGGGRERPSHALGRCTAGTSAQYLTITSRELGQELQEQRVGLHRDRFIQAVLTRRRHAARPLLFSERERLGADAASDVKGKIGQAMGENREKKTASLEAQPRSSRAGAEIVAISAMSPRTRSLSSTTTSESPGNPILM